jgi:hypothetical protein
LWWSSSKSSRLTLGCFFNYIMIYLWNPMIVESLIIYIYIYVYIMAIYIYIYIHRIIQIIDEIYLMLSEIVLI